jgi:nudix-type nucleoside diphosphatase (YffH/AdpP family)
MGERMEDRIRIRKVEVLSAGWSTLKKTTFDFRRRDGRWQTQSRETYDRGDGCAVLLYSRRRACVLLIRQFRFPAYANGHPEPLIEACAGLLDTADPETCIRRETEEETGYRIDRPVKILESFMSPGSVTERLHLFVAEYDPESRIAAGGGVESEEEDIETLELGLDQALAMVEAGEILDAKTIMLLQWAKLHRLME